MTQKTDPYRSPASDTSEALPSSLPVKETLLATLNRLVVDRVNVLRALALPVILLLAITGVQWAVVNSGTDGSIEDAVRRSSILTVISLLPLLVWGLLAISCHRVMLRDDDGPTVLDAVRFGRRQIGYLWRAAVIGLPLVLVGSVLFIILRVELGYGESGTLDGFVVSTSTFAVLLPFQYLMARLSLVLPAAALLHPMTFGQSWRETRGMGWRLAAVLLAAPAAMLVINQLISFARADFWLPSYLLSYVLNMFAGVFSIAALSLSYSWIMDEGLGTGIEQR